MVLKDQKEFATSGKQKGSVRKETNAVSGTKKTTPKTAPPSEPPSQRGRSEPQRPESIREVRSTAVQKLLER